LINEKKLKKILDELTQLRTSIIKKREKQDNHSMLQQNNLSDYVALRNFDISKLQNELTALGLSSLGRAQSCVISSIDQDITLLSQILRLDYKYLSLEKELDFKTAKKLLKENTEIFGATDKEKFKTKVMVTLPSEAATSNCLIKELIEKGTSVLRINTAHDNEEAWKKMAQYIKNENKAQNKNTKIYVDLAGPKNRTGKITKVFTPFTIGSKQKLCEVDIIPQSKIDAFTKKEGKDSFGRKCNSSLSVNDSFYKKCFKMDKIKIIDPLRKKEIPCKVYIKDDRVFITPHKKITITNETMLSSYNNKLSTKLFNLSYLAQKIRVYQEDTVVLTHQNVEGRINYTYQNKQYSAIISCTNKEIFPYLKIGDEIFIDDGKIGFIVTENLDIGVVLKVILAKENGSILKEEKGINFPNTDLEIPAITYEDLKNLYSTLEFADIIGVSFTQTTDDIKTIQDILYKEKKDKVAIVPKIETKTGVRNLPQILHKLIQRPKYGLMIARGDLAVEVGFDNLPYIQEEIFNICESALVPVIYATQILEGKMKHNLPSRAEVTDAAFAQRADCVMLNKGPYVVDTVTILRNILRSMHKLFQKNRHLLSVCTAWNLEKNLKTKVKK